MSATRSSGHYLGGNAGCSEKVNVPGKEFGDAVDGMIGDAGEDAGQIGSWIEFVQFS